MSSTVGLEGANCPVVVRVNVDTGSVSLSVNSQDQARIKASVVPDPSDPTETACVTAEVFFPLVVRAAESANATPAAGAAGSQCTDPDGNQGITVQILGAPEIQCDPSMNCTQPVISTTDGTPPPAQSVVVGQQIRLTTIPAATDLTALGLSFSKNTWTVDGTNIGGYPVSTASATVTETVLDKPDITFYWVYPKDENIPVTYKYCVDIPGADADGKCSLTARAAFTVSGGGKMSNTPYKKLTIDQLIPCVDGVPPKSGGTKSPFLVYGNITGYGCTAVYPGSTFGISFQPSGAQSGGTYSYVQLLNSDTRTLNTISCTTSQGVDLSYPYAGIIPATNPPQAEDAPNFGLPDHYVVTRSFNATMFLLWTSNVPNSIPVPIGYQTWGFTGSAEQNSSEKWKATTDGTPGPIEGFKLSKDNQQTDGYTTLHYGYPIWNGPAVETCN